MALRSTARSFPLGTNRRHGGYATTPYARLRISELRNVDSLLRDDRRCAFAVRGIVGCDDPARLKELIPTDGWEPVDVQIKVTDVATLVRKLGGEALYGNDQTVPLRELIQNSADAVQARRLIEKKESNWGEIDILKALIGLNGQDVITVSDNGIGMSREVLCGPFL